LSKAAQDFGICTAWQSAEFPNGLDSAPDPASGGDVR